MYRNILLAYDGTLEGRLALREGALLAKRCQAKVTLLAIVETESFIPVAGDAGVIYVPRDQTEDYQKVLDEGEARLTRMGLAHTALLRRGDPVASIAAVAKEIGADLVVVGHHRQGLLARWLRGSVTAALIDELDCSLLTARMEIGDEALFG
jgi:nucleotide-binding universal stress UspA family protein